jgi:hypothetical protein
MDAGHCEVLYGDLETENNIIHRVTWNIVLYLPWCARILLSVNLHVRRSVVASTR